MQQTFWIEVGLPCYHMYQHVSLYNAVYLPASCLRCAILILNITGSENDSLYKILAPQWRFDKRIMVFNETDIITIISQIFFKSCIIDQVIKTR